jgi:hypothetical protein
MSPPPTSGTQTSAWEPDRIPTQLGAQAASGAITAEGDQVDDPRCGDDRGGSRAGGGFGVVVASERVAQVALANARQCGSQGGSQANPKLQIAGFWPRCLPRLRGRKSPRSRLTAKAFQYALEFETPSCHYAQP